MSGKRAELRDGVDVEAAVQHWAEGEKVRALGPAYTESGIMVKPLYTPLDVAGQDYLEDLGLPGEPPFTRGVYPTMYRGQLWTFRQYAGFGTAEESNARYHYLLSQGQTALSVAFDLPTQIGYDSDHTLAIDEVGRVGVAVANLGDMETLFQGLPLDRLSVNFTINATAPIILAYYLVAAERQGVSWQKLSGTLQNDILKEFLARGTYIFPLEPSLRLVGDIIEFCSQQVPRLNPISVTGYHAREAGADAIQELAFTLSAAKVYVDTVLSRGLSFDDFAPRLSFHFVTGLDFFEEIAKLRAARRLWSRLARELYHSRNPRSQALRFFAGCSGACLTAVEPLNNLIRSTIQCLAAVLSGAQSIHVMAYDEALEIPSEESALLTLRTQQIIAEETGVTRVIDPLGGSWYVEWLTNEIERRVRELMDRLEASGGYLAALQRGEPQAMIAETAYRHQQAIESGEKPQVGVNRYVTRKDSRSALPHRLFRLDREGRQRQLAKLERWRQERDQRACQQALASLRESAAGKANLMPALLEAVRAGATTGEMADALRAVLGEYQPLRVV